MLLYIVEYANAFIAARIIYLSFFTFTYLEGTVFLEFSINLYTPVLGIPIRIDNQLRIPGSFVYLVYTSLYYP